MPQETLKNSHNTKKGHSSVWGRQEGPAGATYLIFIRAADDIEIQVYAALVHNCKSLQERNLTWGRGGEEGGQNKASDSQKKTQMGSWS